MLHILGGIYSNIYPIRILNANKTTIGIKVQNANKIRKRHY